MLQPTDPETLGSKEDPLGSHWEEEIGEIL